MGTAVKNLTYSTPDNNNKRVGGTQRKSEAPDGQSNMHTPRSERPRVPLGGLSAPTPVPAKAKATPSTFLPHSHTRFAQKLKDTDDEDGASSSAQGALSPLIKPTSLQTTPTCRQRSPDHTKGSLSNKYGSYDTNTPSGAPGHEQHAHLPSLDNTEARATCASLQAVGNGTSAAASMDGTLHYLAKRTCSSPSTGTTPTSQATAVCLSSCKHVTLTYTSSNGYASKHRVSCTLLIFLRKQPAAHDAHRDT